MTSTHISEAEQLQIIARKKRWAFEELIADCVTHDLNRLESRGVKSTFRFLKSKCGSGRAVLGAALQIHQQQRGRRHLTATTDHDLLMELAHYNEGVFFELAYQVLAKEAEQLFRSPKLMFDYLKERYGSGRAVLSELTALLSTWRTPAKSLRLRHDLARF